MALREASREGDVVTVEVQALDEQGVPCLDARNVVRFGLTGDGTLVDNLGTSTGSRQVQLYNGRATIAVEMNEGRSVLSVASEGMATQFLDIGP
jgi:beta-galactosidase